MSESALPESELPRYAHADPRNACTRRASHPYRRHKDSRESPHSSRCHRASAQDFICPHRRLGHPLPAPWKPWRLCAQVDVALLPAVLRRLSRTATRALRPARQSQQEPLRSGAGRAVSERLLFAAVLVPRHVDPQVPTHTCAIAPSMDHLPDNARDNLSETEAG